MDDVVECLSEVIQVLRLTLEDHVVSADDRIGRPREPTPRAGTWPRADECGARPGHDREPQARHPHLHARAHPRDPEDVPRYYLARNQSRYLETIRALAPNR
jgi:hypothetical protein